MLGVAVVTGWLGCSPAERPGDVGVSDPYTRCPEPDPALGPSTHDGPPARSPAHGLWSYQAQPSIDPELVALALLGYLDGTEPARTDATSGVTVNRDGATDGPVAILMALDGTEIHRWTVPFRTLWPERLVDDRRSEHQYWRRATLRPNGDVLAIVEGQGLVRLDWGGEVRWAWGGAAHHDLEVMADERVWVLSREARYRPELHVKPFLEDEVTRLGADGCPELQINLMDAVLASEARDALLPAGAHGDVFHTNSLRVLDAEAAAAHPAFEPGFLLLSMRTPSAVLVLDPERAEIVWWWQGPFREQHDAEITSDGRLVVFDNIGLGEGHSAVRAFRLADRTEAWRIDEVDDRTLDSRYLGAVQRLGGGHVLVTESGQGHAFERDADGEVVWAFHNPERTGPHGEFVAILPEMLRVPAYYSRAPSP